MSKKLLSLLVLLLVAGLILIGCGGAATEPAAEQPAAEEPAAEQGAAEAPAAAGEPITISIWHGYIETEEKTFSQTVADFMAANPDVKIDVLAVPFDELQNKFQTEVASGGGPTLITGPQDRMAGYAEAGLLAEIDTTKLTNYNKLYDQFKTPDYITFDGKLYGVNFAWGPTIVIYNTEEITTEPTSWNALLDEQYKGKIATWNYPIQIAQYALLLDPKPTNPYELTDEQLAQVKDILVRQRPLVRKYWDLGGEVAQLFVNGEVVISDGWSWITLQIKDSDGKIAEATPLEGVTGWSDSWCISNKAANPELALKWADYMIGPEGQKGVLDNLNYSLTNKVVVESLPMEVREALRMVDVPAEYAKIHM